MRGLGDIVDIPFITTDQMREVDRAMIEDYGISLAQMMENVGRNLTQLARSRFLQGDPTGPRVLVLAGKGGNGGAGRVCAGRAHGGAAAARWGSLRLSGWASSAAAAASSEAGAPGAGPVSSKGSDMGGI